MKMKGKCKNLFVMASAFVLSASLLTAAAPPVWADNPSDNQVTASSEEQKKDYTITFEDETGKTLDTFPASAGETWGPSGDVSVRSTYYKDGVDYDIVSGSGVGDLSAESACLQTGQSAPITGNMTFTYKKHTDAAVSEKTYKCLTEDGTLLYMFTGSEKDIPQTLNPGNCVYTRSNKADDSTDESVVNFYYTLASDTDTNYSVTVNYVDADDGSTITFRTFYVNNKTYIFHAPLAFSITNEDSVVNYRAVDNTTITHEVSDTKRSYDIQYRKQTADSKESYTWYILLYNSETNRCIDSEPVEVKADNSADNPASFTPEKTISVNGSSYTINKAFDKTFTHAYDDTSRTTYIYYDPEGYDNSSEIRSRDINIQYVNIANGSVLQSTTKTVTSEGDTEIAFPDSLDVDSVHYLRVAGQAESVTHNFYSPKETYTVYYYDQNNTEFQKAVIRTEEIQEVTVTDGGTTYRVIPGITRTVVTNTDTGVSNIVATNDSTGASIAPVTAGGGQNSANTTDNTAADTNGNTAGNTADTSNEASGGTAGGTDSDASIDGVQADEIQTPQSNIKLDTEKDNSSSRNIIVMAVSLAVLAACAVVVVLLVRRRKISRH